MSLEKRRRAFSKGHRAETWAAVWLQLHGWRILARRHKSPHGEIDLIARRGSLLAFIEVKARTDRESGLGAISARQRDRIRRSAEAFMVQKQWQGRARFDAIVVMPGPLGLPRITWVKAAWD